MNEWAKLVELLGSGVITIALLTGLWLAVTAVYIPGLGFPEAGGLASLLVTAAGLIVLPANPLGLLLLAAALGAFLARLYYRDRPVLSLAGYVFQLLGSIFLFRVEARPGLWVILLGNLAGVAYHQIVLLPGLRIQSRDSPLDVNTLVGTIAPVVTTIDPVGLIRVQGEVWSACADELIEAGRWVRIVGRNGLRLRVVPTDPVRT